MCEKPNPTSPFQFVSEKQETVIALDRRKLLLRRDAVLLVLGDRGGLVGALVLRGLLDDIGHALEREVVIPILGEGVLLAVYVAEGEVEDDGEDAADDGWSTEVPGEVGVADDRRASEADAVCDGGVEQVDSGDETPHILGRARVCDAVGEDGDEEHGDAAEGEGYGHPPDSDGGDEGDAVGVDAVGHAADGAEVDVALAEEGVQAVVDDGGADDDREGVEVVDDVVGDTVDTEWEETEDSGGLECAANILHELVVPPHTGVASLSKNDRRLGWLPRAVTADSLPSTVCEADTQNAEDVWQVASSRWVGNKAVAKEPEEERERKVENKWQEETQPEADVLFAVSSSNLDETTDVDQEEEPEHDSLGGGLGVDNDPLA
ncbi:hypothetical protein V501_01139 [Pseudogymnoascus sp. VKM F-4519 (FW-2642)]|nr:hypothetical protein V501_01139 [Pseudogymnoascus sp. VKM F-4519 (FW-2642)]